MGLPKATFAKQTPLCQRHNIISAQRKHHCEATPFARSAIRVPFCRRQHLRRKHTRWGDKPPCGGRWIAKQDGRRVRNTQVCYRYSFRIFSFAEGVSLDGGANSLVTPHPPLKWSPFPRWGRLSFTLGFYALQDG